MIICERAYRKHWERRGWFKRNKKGRWLVRHSSKVEISLVHLCWCFISGAVPTDKDITASPCNRIDVQPIIGTWWTYDVGITTAKPAAIVLNAFSSADHVVNGLDTRTFEEKELLSLSPQRILIGLVIFHPAENDSDWSFRLRIQRSSCLAMLNPVSHQSQVIHSW